MEMLPVWAILLIPLATAFGIALFLQNHDRAAATAAIASIATVFALTLALPFMTIPVDGPGSDATLEVATRVEGAPATAYIYRQSRRLPVDALGSEDDRVPARVEGWQIRTQRSVFDWAAIGTAKVAGRPLPLGVPPALARDGLKIEFGVMVDTLAFFMLFVVGFVGLLVHIFSVGYLAHEGAWGRYFAGLQLFCFSMLGIVLSPNYVQTFIFWELVGVSSYVLIGHYYQRDEPPEAAKKAFMTNRVADFGFMIGILLLFTTTGTVDFARFGELAREFPALFGADAAAGGLGTWIGVLLFVGCMGKSAQFPFHIWLPDAMAGPTPVSALMHAATMVAAGVYLVLRSYPIYNPEALRFIAWVGVTTAVLSALVAVVQNDIKKVLAYSTLSQLGYMMMALGLGGYAAAAHAHYPAISVAAFQSQCYTAGMFHLTTHAFFKALLFLASGAVIAGMHHRQDMREMGGLMYRMPHTFVCFFTGTLALAGCVPLAGFFSKDLILHLAHQGNHALYVLASGAAFLTSFYMGRALWLTFFGEARSRDAEEAREVGLSMLGPLYALAVLSAVAGYWGQTGVPGFIDVEGHGRPFSVLVFHEQAWWPHLDTTIAAISTAVFAVAFGLSYLMYGLGVLRSDWYESVPGLAGLYALVEKKFYCDEVALFLVKQVQDTVAHVLNFIEQKLLIGLGIYEFVALFRRAGGGLRRMQTGDVRAYASLLVLGTLAVLFLVGAPLIRFGG